MTDTDLTIVATDDLLDELAGRHDAMIFAGYKNKSDEISTYQRFWRGGNIPALGLAEFISMRIRDACNDMDRFEEGDEGYEDV